MSRKRLRLTSQQLVVLGWIRDGCPDDRFEGNAHKASAAALQSRRLVTVSRKSGRWGASLTADGEYYLEHDAYPPATESTAVTSLPTAREALRRTSDVRASRQTPSQNTRPDTPARARAPIQGVRAELSSSLQAVPMRYKVIVSRVQTAERHVRAVNEEEAIAKVQAELDRPYGFLGSWTTADTDMDIVEVASPLPHVPDQIVGSDGAFLLSVKGAATYLGIPTSAIYDLIYRGEIAHVQIGSRRYISRDQMRAFVDANTHVGYHQR